MSQRDRRDRKERILFQHWLDLPLPRTVPALREKCKKLKVRLPSTATIYRWKNDWEREAKMLDGYVKGKLSLTEAIAKEIEEREKAEMEAAMDRSPEEEESTIEEPIDEEPEPETDRAAEIEEAHVVPMNAHQANYEEIAAVGGQSICDTLIQLTGKTRLAVERYEVPEKVLPKDLLAISGVYKNFAQTAQIFHNLKMEMEGLSSVLEEVEALLSAR